MRIVSIYYTVIIFSVLISSLAQAGEAQQTVATSDFTVTATSPKMLTVTSTNESYEIKLPHFLESMSASKAFPYVLIATTEEEEITRSPYYMDSTCYVLDLSTRTLHPFHDQYLAPSAFWSPDGTWFLFSNKVHPANALIHFMETGKPLATQLMTDVDCSVLYEYNSWRWLGNDRIIGYGGACGTFMGFIFERATSKGKAYCLDNQRPSYGCPNSMPTETVLRQRIKELESALQ